MQRADFTEHMTSHYTAENSVLSVSGNVEHEQVVAWATASFGDLPARAAPAGQASNPIGPRRTSSSTRGTSSRRTWRSRCGRCGGKDPDRYALDLMNTALGRGMSSRLFQEVRERRGLAYSVSAGGSRFLIPVR